MIYLYLSPFFLFAYVVIAGLAFRIMGGPRKHDTKPYYDLLTPREWFGVFAAVWPATLVVVVIGWIGVLLVGLAAWVARGGKEKRE